MVTTRNFGSNSDTVRKAMDDSLDVLGDASVTLVRTTDDTDADGRIDGLPTKTEVTIKAEVQPVNAWKDTNLLQAGLVSMGDIKIYVKHSEMIDTYDYIVYDGARWELTNNIEKQFLGGDEIFQCWTAMRRDTNGS